MSNGNDYFITPVLSCAFQCMHHDLEKGVDLQHYILPKY